MSDYLLKANIILAVLYVFYRLFFYRDTFFGLRRILLLSIIAVSVVLPLPAFQAWVEGMMSTEAAEVFAAGGLLPEVVVKPALEREGVSWQYWLGCGYVAGICLLVGRIGVQGAAIARLSRRCPPTEVEGVCVRSLPQGQTPFSFFHQIFVCPEAHTSEELREILAHEQTHARQAHSVDVLMGELACAFFWFNPFAWLLKREMRINLEYLADRCVLAEGHDRKAYQYHLLGLTCHKAAATIYNNFNVLPLKKRIKMMNKQRTKNIGRLKYLLFLPMAALLAAACNGKQNPQKAETAQEETVEAVQPAPQPETPAATATEQAGRQAPPPPVMKSSEVSATNAIGTAGKEPGRQAPPPPRFLSETIVDVPDVQPMFPGGALHTYFAENLQYPEDAAKAGKEGRVVLEFIVADDGTIHNVKVLRSLCESCDNEAIRLVKSMPVWTPGKLDGKNVSVRFVLPIVFKLS